MQARPVGLFPRPSLLPRPGLAESATGSPCPACGSLRRSPARARGEFCWSPGARAQVLGGGGVRFSRLSCTQQLPVVSVLCGKTRSPQSVMEVRVGLVTVREKGLLPFQADMTLDFKRDPAHSP